MSERIFILGIGLSILFALYIELDIMMYGLAVYLMLEGITNIRLTRLLQASRNVTLDDGLYLYGGKNRFELEATRLWRIVVAIVLATSFILLHEYNYDVLWFFPWFLGFALTGAGVSGVCPVLIAIKFIGFK